MGKTTDIAWTDSTLAGRQPARGHRLELRPTLAVGAEAIVRPHTEKHDERTLAIR